MNERRLKVVRIWAPGRYAILRISVDNMASYYRVYEIESEIGGRGWEVWKLGADDRYHVLIGQTPADCSCSCIGFDAERICRHVSALWSMTQRGLLGEANDASSDRSERDSADDS